jgi:hypothetical protein
VFRALVLAYYCWLIAAAASLLLGVCCLLLVGVYGVFTGVVRCLCCLLGYCCCLVVPIAVCWVLRTDLCYLIALNYYIHIYIFFTYMHLIPHRSQLYRQLITLAHNIIGITLFVGNFISTNIALFDHLVLISLRNITPSRYCIAPNSHCVLVGLDCINPWLLVVIA